MTLTFIYLSTFEADRKRLRLGEADVEELEKLLARNPDAGRVIRGTGGARKIRFAPPSWHTGKSGGARVVYTVFSVASRVYFLAAYAKNEREDITEPQRASFRELNELLRRAIEAKRGAE